MISLSIENANSSPTTAPLPGGPSTAGELFRRVGIPLADSVAPETALAGIRDDSRAVGVGDLFIAIRGEGVDGHNFIARAFEKGAPLAVAERTPEGIDPRKVVLVDDGRIALGALAHAYWNFPSRAMSVVGITGTNGKTTTVYLVESMLKQSGRRPLVMGTIEYRYGRTREPAPVTTPGALEIASLMGRARADGADSAAMEISSHALVQRRVEAVDFDVALMTNLTQDHLDYHTTMEEYREAKRLLYTRCRPRIALFNLDDPTGCSFAEDHGGSKLTYSLDANAGADLAPLALEVGADHIEMALRLPPGDEEMVIRSPLLGRFNASNLLAAAAVGVALGLTPKTIAGGLEAMAGAPGRFEAIRGPQPFAVFCDYAHTPDAVNRLLENVRSLARGPVIVVLGCGGDRDPQKRPRMGAALGRWADYSIITNDNPRTEVPEKIAAAMEEGIRTTARRGAYEVCLDRREAIRRALERAERGDTVVIAGKGHEDYQEIGGERRHFDDRETVREICEDLFPRGTET